MALILVLILPSQNSHLHTLEGGGGQVPLAVFSWRRKKKQEKSEEN